MKNLIILFILFVLQPTINLSQPPSNQLVNNQTANNPNPESIILAKTELPVFFDKSGAGVAFVMTEDEYKDISKAYAKLPDFKIKYPMINKKPSNLTSEAVYGMNLVVNSKNISWIIDGNDDRGYTFYGDWNGDGDLTNDEPIKFQKESEKYQLIYKKQLTETIDNKKQNYDFAVKLVIDRITPSGKAEKKLALKIYDRTIRRGILNVNNRQMSFGLIGSSGFYNTQYDTIYFDLNGDNDFDVKNRYSAERYKIPEKHINIGDKTYQFSVDRYGENITLTPLNEKLPARVDLSQGYQAPNFSFQDINGKKHQLSDFHGKIVLLDFWGTWCGPCVAEAPALSKTYKKLKEKGFEIISLAKGDTIEDIQKFISKREMNWIHSQIDDPLSELYRIDAFPTYFLIDKDGKIISNDMKAGEKMYKKIEELLTN